MLAKFVERYGQLLVVAILVVVVHLEFVLFLGSYHALHEGNGRVVLTVVLTLLRLNNHLVKRTYVGSQTYNDVVLAILGYVNHLRLVAHSREGKFPSVATGDGKRTILVGKNIKVMSAVCNAYTWYTCASLGIKDYTTDVLCCSTKSDK